MDKIRKDFFFSFRPENCQFIFFKFKDPGMESMPEKLLYFIWGPGTPLLNTIGCIGGSWAKSKLEKFEHLLEGITGLTAARTF